jgi:glycosyltransferase involved in cell wall biosynthesis
VRVALVNLTSGGLSGGSRKYLLELVPLLRAHPAVRDLHVFLPPSVRETVAGAESWPSGDGFRGFRSLRDRIGALAPDVVFIPTARWIDCGPVPAVVMVRNMEPIVVPLQGNPPAEAMKNLARAFEAKRACRRSQRVVAVSGYVRDVLRDRWHIDEGKIGVVYHGVDPARGSGRRPASLARVDDRPFVFTAGSIRPARGLEDLVSALSHAKRTGGFMPTVVIAGEVSPGGAGYRRRLERSVVAAGVDDRIVWAGALDRQEMAWCFSQCLAFVMTSRVEACPNVVLEAMSYRCACVSVDLPPMPEFFGTAALYYPAGNGAALAGQLTDTQAANGSDAARLRQDAERRASQFAWTTTAERTVAELEKVLGR